jgi:hypothetical protein
MYEDKKLTQQEVLEMITPLKLDLISFSKLLEEAAFKIVDKGVKGKWTPDKIIKEIEKLLDNNGKIAELIK